MPELHEKLTANLKAKNLKKVDIAHQLNISKSSVSKWCLGQGLPYLKHAVPLVKLLDKVENKTKLPEDMKITLQDVVNAYQKKRENSLNLKIDQMLGQK